MSTQELYRSLEKFVEQSLRGRTVSNRRTIGESLLDQVPSSARQIVFGMAFQQWTGARLAHLVLNVNRTWQHLFIEVAGKRLRDMDERWQNDVVLAIERDALLGLLFELGHHDHALQEQAEKVFAAVGATELITH